MNSVDGDLILKDGQKVYISVGEDSTEMYYYTNPGNPATLIKLNPETLQAQAF